jgi:hypothetical protein
MEEYMQRTGIDPNSEDASVNSVMDVLDSISRGIHQEDPPIESAMSPLDLIGAGPFRAAGKGIISALRSRMASGGSTNLPAVIPEASTEVSPIVRQVTNAITRPTDRREFLRNSLTQLAMKTVPKLPKLISDVVPEILDAQFEEIKPEVKWTELIPDIIQTHDYDDRELLDAILDGGELTKYDPSEYDPDNGKGPYDYKIKIPQTIIEKYRPILEAIRNADEVTWYNRPRWDDDGKPNGRSFLYGTRVAGGRLRDFLDQARIEMNPKHFREAHDIVTRELDMEHNRRLRENDPDWVDEAYDLDDDDDDYDDLPPEVAAPTDEEIRQDMDDLDFFNSESGAAEEAAKSEFGTFGHSALVDAEYSGMTGMSARSKGIEDALRKFYGEEKYNRLLQEIEKRHRLSQQEMEDGELEEDDDEDLPF